MRRMDGRVVVDDRRDGGLRHAEPLGDLGEGQASGAELADLLGLVVRPASIQRRPREPSTSTMVPMLLFVLLTIHSWFRWAVVLSTLTVGARYARGWIRRRSWTPTDSALARAWVGAIDIQVSLGLLLYFTASPLADIARQDLRGAWSDDSLRFFGILHPLSMLAAAFVAHAAWIWTRRTEDGANGRFRRLGLGVLGVLVLVVLAIPWPFLSYGRPVTRM